MTELNITININITFPMYETKRCMTFSNFEDSKICVDFVTYIVENLPGSSHDKHTIMYCAFD